MFLNELFSCRLFFVLQGDCRTYSYVAALSSDQPPDWKDLLILAKIIPRICLNVNRYLLELYHFLFHMSNILRVSDQNGISLQ